MIHSTSLAILATILIQAIANTYDIEEFVITYQEENNSYFKELQHVLDIQLKINATIFPALMYQYETWKDLTEEDTIFYSFQIILPDVNNAVYSVLEGEMPPWSQYHGKRLLSTAKVKSGDGVFVVAKSSEGSSLLIKGSVEWFSNVSLEVLSLLALASVDNITFSVQMLAQSQWIDSVPEPLYNINGDRVGQLDHLTSTIRSSLEGKPILLSRSENQVYLLVQSDGSVKWMAYDLMHLTYGFKRLIIPAVVNSTSFTQLVGSIEVENEVWIAVELDTDHLASFENYHGINISFPNGTESIGVVLGYDKNGSLLIIEPVIVHGCVNTVLKSIAINGSSNIAVGGSCRDKEGLYSPVIHSFTLKPSPDGPQVVERLSQKLSLERNADIYSVLWLTPDSILAVGGLVYYRDNMLQVGDAYIAVFNISSGEKEGIDRWGGSSTNSRAYDLRRVQIVQGETVQTTYYCLATFSSLLSENNSTSDAAMYRVMISDETPQTPWFILIVVLSCVFVFLLFAGVVVFILNKRTKPEEKHLLAAHPKTKMYTKLLFKRFSSKKEKPKQPE